MKRRKESYDDGLEWLREIRRRQFASCGHDVHKLFEMYRQRHRQEMNKRDREQAALREKSK